MFDQNIKVRRYVVCVYSDSVCGFVNHIRYLTVLSVSALPPNLNTLTGFHYLLPCRSPTMAPAAGLEPATQRLTAACSTN